MTNTYIAPKPEGSTWTDEQWQAIAARGDHLLVAAAAGSGKTAVLVERIIRTVSDEARPIDIDRLLVATFTNAAAAEMRHRLRDALEKALTAKPQSRHLRKQLALVGRASITTLHSFCLDVVRRYVHLTELDPAFRIANETEAALLRQEALEAVFEERYGEAAETDPFWQLADRFGGERGDDALMKLVDRLYDFSRSHPFPELWLREAAAAFRLDAGADEEASAGAVSPDHPWLASLAADAKLELEAIVAGLRSALELSMTPSGPSAYVDNLSADAEGVERLLGALVNGGWPALQEAAAGGLGGAFGRLKPQKKGDTADEAVVERVKKLRKDAKERLDALIEQLLTRSTDDYAAECRALAPLMDELVRLVLDYAEAFRRAKTAKGLVDFGDLEHACLHILRDPSSTPDRIVPTPAALGYREQFEEVYVDEYQDTNAVQETILRLVSRGETENASGAAAPGNRFMVGDVKQSIYRFRLAEPGLFLRKYKTYRPFAEAARDIAAGGGVRIDLARNFRSRQEVVDAVNFVFRQTMHEEAAELDYDERAELVRGASYPEPDPTHGADAEALLLDRTGGAAPSGDGETGEETEAADADAAELEGRAIALRILELIGAAGKPAMAVFDKAAGGMRPASFRDVVILLRADKAWAPTFLEQLRAHGVPAHAELGGGYFEAVEVETALSLLQTIDNPLQDIPLAAALRSPVFGFTAEELARVRIAGGRGRSFYEAVGAVASGRAEAPEALREKTARFVSTLETWRTAARQGSLSDLILRLYRETGYFDFVGGLPGGEQRQANLRALYDRARQYEATSFRGLFRFLRFIERLRDSGSDLAPARALGEAEDVVRIMSIHKSKGLEFPIVFVAGLGKSFNRGDEREPFLVHKELGFGPRWVDPELGTAYPTLPQLAIKRRLRAEALAEEMRVLYVALTRAKEKLILVGSAKELPKRLAEWNALAALPGPKLPAHAVRRGACFLDWLVPALLRHPAAEELREAYGLDAPPAESRVADGSRWRLVASLPGADALQEAAPASERKEPWVEFAVREARPAPDDWAARDGDVMRVLGWQDPRPAASALFAKTSVTEWKRRLQEEEDEPTNASFPGFGGSAGFGGSGLAEGGDAESAPERASKSAADGASSAGSAGKPPARIPAKRPRFLSRRGLTPVERGVAYHTAMQHLALSPGLAAADVEAQLSSLVLRELLTEEQRQAIDVDAVARFAHSEPGQRLMRAGRSHRELPFSVGLPASVVYGEAPHGVPLDEATARETVLVQGIIDCLFEDEQGLAMIDYKTDAVYDEARLAELVAQYRLQLAVYAKAAETALGRPVPDRYLYFFDGARAVKL
ncbi:helicase-exonuclease AddAB subunit AddA [Paenibacillus sp.]|uniref:helicase-exonuclease AddAB subunit AddA n=1 Tax=Paenibacillus sp. TaxID=58172 RepID=UPI002D4D60DD|nr:helicase-exonuclease AddAB subunit AddA [Paenibacillus sp.]HZG84702.1 helicase-exonuclease AddAB subunit AddA [Paenibacillus sp.]